MLEHEHAGGGDCDTRGRPETIGVVESLGAAIRDAMNNPPREIRRVDGAVRPDGDAQQILIPPALGKRIAE